MLLMILLNLVYANSCEYNFSGTYRVDCPVTYVRTKGELLALREGEIVELKQNDCTNLSIDKANGSISVLDLWSYSKKARNLTIQKHFISPNGFSEIVRTEAHKEFRWDNPCHSYDFTGLSCLGIVNPIYWFPKKQIVPELIIKRTFTQNRNNSMTYEYRDPFWGVNSRCNFIKEDL